MRDLAIFRALRHRPFRYLWLGQSVSRLGDGMHTVALVWWVLLKTGSGLAMGTVMICQTVPMVVFALFGGVVVDRFDRLRIMIVSDVLRACVTAFMAIFAYRGELEIWQVYVAAGVYGFVDAFFQPAYLAIVPRLARDDLPSANAVTMLSTRILRVAGPSVSAMCIATAGSSLVFAVDSASFLISIGFLLAVTRSMQNEPEHSDDDFLGLSAHSFGGFTDIGAGRGALGGGTVTFMRAQDLNLSFLTNKPSKGHLRELIDEVRAGFRFVNSRVLLWMPMLVFGFINTFDYSAFTLALPYLITRVFNLHAGAYGILQSLGAVGLALAAIILGRQKRLRRRGARLFTGVLAVGICGLALATPITIYGVGAFVLFRALAYGTLELTVLNVFQQKVPPDKLGRVFAIDNFLSMLMMPFGLALTGWATDRFDPRAIFFVSGLMVILISFGFRHREIRKLN